MAERIAMSVNGSPVETSAGCSVAAGVMQAHGPAFRTSITGQPRGPLCGMGVCFECRLTIGGLPHQRSCQTSIKAGMQIQTSADVRVSDNLSANTPQATMTSEVDVLVVGAGPAGIAAACCAAEAGRRIGVIDDNPRAGGQIWRYDGVKTLPKQAATWLSRLRALPIQHFTSMQILGALQPSTLLAESPRGLHAIHYRRLILACGARERFLPFPGWTLPGVYGAGGLQALVKSGLALDKQKVIVAGSGPLLLAVAAYLRERGADVRLLAEQAPRNALLRFGMSLLLQPRKLMEGLALAWRLRRSPYRSSCWPVRANGRDRLESVTLTDGARTWTEPCDALACGFGLMPNLELPMLLGCAIANGIVQVDEQQQTSQSGVYAVGELTGIGGLDKALIEGQIAGWAAAEQPERARPLVRRRDKTHQFVSLLAETFALREELRHLADANTIVCRCEDVTLGQLQERTGWRDAKLQTRCGMGPCQGRICGPAVQFLFAWANDSIRPPIFPTALANLATSDAALQHR